MNTAPLYLQEFPDYDGVLATPDGWQESSWHNDTCPSFLYPLDDVRYGTSLRLWCDYAVPDMREVPDAPRFIVSYCPHDDDAELWSGETFPSQEILADVVAKGRAMAARSN